MADQKVTYFKTLQYAIKKTLGQFFTPPVFPDNEDKTRTAQVLYALLLNMLGIVTLSALATIFVWVEKTGSSILVFILFCLLLTAWILAKRGHVQFASILFLTGIWMVLAFLFVFVGSINSVNTAFFVAISVIAGILLGSRYAIIFAALSSIVGLGLVILENSGYTFIQYFPQPPLASWVDLLLAFLITITALHLALKGTAQALARARKSERRYATLFNEAPMMYLTIRNDGGTLVITDCNAAFFKTLGYTREQVVGQRLTRFYTPESQAALLLGDGFQRALRDDIKAPIKRTLVAQDGRIIHTVVRAAPDVDETGQSIGVLAMGLDITESKRTEEALLESELKYRTLFKTMSQGFYLSQILYDENRLPNDYRFIDVNPVFEQIMGVKKEQLIGKTYTELVPPDPESGWLDCFKRVATTGVPENYTFSSKIYNSYFEVYAFKPEKDKFSALVKDITESKQAEEKIHTALAEKETLLRELYHRTKNNMSVIISLLALQADYVNDPRLTDAFKEAQNRIRSMALVHQKLYETQDLSRINLKEYFDDLLNLLMKSYKVSPEKLSIVPEMENVLVLIDTAIPCGLILNELISNSLKHAFPDGREGEIKVQLHRMENGELLLCVADNGLGVPEGLDFRRDGQLGLQSIFSLGETQLGGKIEFKVNPGVSFQLLFRDDLYKPRV